MKQIALDIDDSNVHAWLLKHEEAQDNAIIWSKKATAYLVKAQSICDHKGYENTTSKYEAGGYLNKEYTDYTTKCSLCNKVLKKWTEQGDHFG